MGKLWQDIRFGVRVLVKSPGFAVVTILALALGIGANSAIFSVVNGVLLRPLPFKTADRLVFLSEWSQQVPNMSVSYPNFQDWRAQSHSFDELAAFRSNAFVLTNAGEPERLTAREVSQGFFPALGVAPAQGRNFSADEDKPGGNKTVILSHGIWQRRFGANPAALGQQLTLNNESYTVVGILPQGFEWQSPVDIWIPLGLRADRMQQRDSHPGIYVVGLLKNGVTEEQARSDMRGVAERLAQEYPKTNSGNGFTLTSLQFQATQNIRSSLFVLMAAVAFVLLIACANVANLLLARAASRSKEIAIRTALGAGRVRIIRQLLTESLLLSLAGGALGLLLATWGIDALLAAVSNDVPAIILANVRLDSRVIFFTIGASVVTGLLFGLAPAIQISKSNLNETLKDGGRGGSEGAARHRVRNFLVVAEVAVSLLLLVGAGLLVKSFLNLRQAELGFEPDRVLTMRLSLPEARYKENAKIENFFNDLLGRVKTLPGVESAGLTIGLPMNGGIESGVTFEGHEVTDIKDITVAVNLAVSPEYFKTMEMPLVEGRYFTEQDREGAPRVAIIDEMMAARFSPNESAVGKRIRLGGGQPPAGMPPMPWMQIVGVVKHLRYYGPNETARVELYRPFFQLPLPADSPLAQGQPVTFPRGGSLAVRAAGDPAALTASIRSVVREIDPDQPISAVQTMNDIVASTISPQKFATWMLGLFAATALVLAALGIYGVMAYSVTQRTHEIGIRMALGANRGDVLKMIVRQGMKLTLLGVGIGLVGSFLVTRAMTTLLFGVKATDPLTYGGVAILLAGVALLSCLLPARRATKVDPMIALRYE
ncbi:MAG TPA: ABC transporter permease [Pyrinomonadaceae bacterium]|jgi:putative ABC transport system permease protein|nr:ABC transporter permease [Pyrinomonadaceae bacterium]